MKNQILFRLLFAGILLVLNFVLTKAQTVTVSSDNGIAIGTKTEISPAISGISPFVVGGSSSKSGSGMYRILKDKNSKTYLGYTIEIKDAAVKGKYMVSISSLPLESITAITKVEGFTEKTLPKYPNPIEVNEGDTIVLDVMENPATKEKVVDYIKVLYKPDPHTDFFPERKPLRDFTIDDASLELSGYEVFADNQSVLKEAGGRSGSNLPLYLPGKGQFIFSLAPHPGSNFQKIGSIEGNKILFKYEGVSYKIVSRAPIFLEGHWNLWVSFDPNYKPRKISISDF